ncbi:HxlR family transcriptional regulator [Flavobacterium sp. Root935]|jgi:DNA-binding HxlR family transcriptional regulator|uniref:winged helix-turn-helix transcriptional regulator n=1 Tax=unclassified Flavobacterium TaxID=196869 RepID=UPI00070E8128|nr:MULTISPECIES: helix-turn-helix domain-containing protein [unclassified Flavobacterium]KRD57580.1 HxlR family transcriptional regulator [Flavobacterium sp. Root935]MDQ1165982.1 DNA-binding HxlR family transcriptional regulator [Flavobacterium sp. SORGH_AS_0622]TDX10213.1 HxlR family transcriptional regulator [Flavobacterium sp. S87F.05.LMB.W.Kidney.N]
MKKIECEPDLIKLDGKTYPCTVSLVMDLMGGKWKAVILYHLKDNPKRYNELRKEMPTVTERTLSLQLKQLEEDGLIFRNVDGKKPPIKVTYGLTDFGKSFKTVLESITQLGNTIASERGEFIVA